MLTKVEVILQEKCGQVLRKGSFRSTGSRHASSLLVPAPGSVLAGRALRLVEAHELSEIAHHGAHGRAGFLREVHCRSLRPEERRCVPRPRSSQANLPGGSERPHAKDSPNFQAEAHFK